MQHEQFDAQIASEMKQLIVLLEDHDLVPAEAGMRSLAERASMTAEGAREQRLVNLRRRLQSGIRQVQHVAPFTALITVREALQSWTQH